MKRVCIYVIYDVQKKINAYIEEVLREIERGVDDMFVVCNFESIKQGREYIDKYASSIICRNNIGFDAGAYKDVLINYITWDELEKYDELILTNDTYFAPLYPFDNMFNTMQKKDCDFWGITRFSEGNIEGIGECKNHIQSYFLCFKREILHSDIFKKYWNDYTVTKSKIDTVKKFEIGINDCFIRAGYKGDSYMDGLADYLSEYGVNPYYQYAYELIKEYKIPIIKRTNFYAKTPFLINTCKAMDYIRNSTNYDFNLICDYITEYQKAGLMGTYFDYVGMGEFVKTHSRIYIYGKGAWGKKVADYFEYKGWKYDSFIVTNPNDDGVKLFSEIDIKNEDGVIIAQESSTVCSEIIKYIGDRCSSSQIYTPCYFDN